jgi:hypothetical protein
MVMLDEPLRIQHIFAAAQVALQLGVRTDCLPSKSLNTCSNKEM